MSDFDNRLSNMMNEEEHFPNMQQNWEKLAPHLHPPQPLKRASLQKRWLVGIAASLSVLAVSAMTCFLVTTYQENKALKNEVNNLKNKTQDIDNKSITYNNNLINNPNNSENSVKNIPSIPNDIGEVKVSESDLSMKNDIKSIAITLYKTSANERKVVTSNSIKIPSQQLRVVSQKEKTQIATPSVFEDKKELLKKTDDLTKNDDKGNITQNKPLNVSKNLDNNKPIVPFENHKNDLNNAANNLNDNILNVETVASPIGEKADLIVSSLGIMLKPIFSNSTATPLSIEKALMLSPAIMRPTLRTGRFAIGVQTFVSLGDNEGKDRRGPALSGFGLVASYDLTRHFELVASADVGGMRYDFRDGGPRGNGIPKEPGEKPKDHPRLKRVSGDQKRQQFSVGLKYKIPTNTFLIPFVNVGYDLQRLGKQSCRFDFANDITNTEVPVTKVEAPQISNNLWHAGIGLEAKVSSFIIGVSAQYQKDFSIKNDNRIILRGGVKYHF
jgi:hypothetical protein